MRTDEQTQGAPGSGQADENTNLEVIRERLAFEHRTRLLDTIKPDWIVGRGYYSVAKYKQDRLSLVQKGFPPKQCRLGLVIPKFDPFNSGTPAQYQLRPDKPRFNEKGQPIKYETPWRTHKILDVHPFNFPKLGDPKVDLIVTEGTIKGDAIACHRPELVIALDGVSSWRGRNAEGGKTALADWNQIALNGRLIIIWFDMDALYKPAVRREALKLADYLRRRGALVRYFDWSALTPGPQRQKAAA